MPARRPLTPDDLHQQVAIGDLAISPDGAVLVYTRRTISGGRDRIDLWAVAWAGGDPWPLTDGPALDTRPRVAPDGRRVAFLRTGEDGRGRVGVVEIGRPSGGAPPPVLFADVERGVSDLVWTADGAALVVVAEDAETPDEQGGTNGSSPTSRTITRLDWRRDGEGLTLHRRHLHRLPAGGGPATRLTTGPWSASNPAAAADGRVLFLADPGPDADRRPRPQIHALDPRSAADPRALTALRGGVDRFTLEPDGAIVLLGHDVDEPRDADPPRAFRIPPEGGAPVPLAPDLNRWPGRTGDPSDLHDWWTDLRDAGAVTGVADGGRVVPCRLAAGGAESLVDPDAWPTCGALAGGHDGRVAAALTLGVGAAAPDVFALEDGGPRRLTTHGGAWLEAFARPSVTRIEVDGPGGPITTFLVDPPGADPAAALPTVLAIHGGPTDQWTCVPTLEAVLLAGAGYRVALPNLRGSIDRGPAWAAALHGAVGDVDAADCHAVLDHLVAAGRADAARLGCCGLSYGGFLTQWLVGTSGRFAAAVAENGVANQIAAWGSCDIGPTYARAAGLGDPTTATGAEALWRTSPLRHVAAIHTPLLMLQGEEDRRCPGSDNEQLFTALRWLGRTVEYVLYPEESHLFQGAGRFDRRVDRHRRTLAWFQRHMPASPGARLRTAR